ncbi:hypothetical protein [Mycobacterium sp. M23085]|uniref:hypothetical protein n=1 Tax=Mycobacterium sp. M23085 TaxID=3378087 RepID=UPI003877C2D7
MPCGFTAAGLPIGLQVVGKPFAEATVLRVGHAYQSAADWPSWPPRFDPRGVRAESVAGERVTIPPFSECH